MSNDIGGYKYNSNTSNSEQERYNQSMDWIFNERVSDGFSLKRNIDIHNQHIISLSNAAVQSSTAQMLQGARSGYMLQAAQQYLAANQTASAQATQDIAAIEADLNKLNNQQRWMQQQANNRPNDPVRQRGVERLENLIAATKSILQAAKKRQEKIAAAVRAGEAFVVQARQAEAEKRQKEEQQRRNQEETARLMRAAKAAQKASQDAQAEQEESSGGGAFVGGGTKEGRDAMVQQTRDLLTASRYAAEQMAITGHGLIVQAEISLASETMTVSQQLGELAIRAAASGFSNMMAELADAEAIREKAFNLNADIEKNRTDNAFTRAKASVQLSKY